MWAKINSRNSIVLGEYSILNPLVRETNKCLKKPHKLLTRQRTNVP